MAKGKSFSDFTYGVGLEVTASSFKQVKDDLKLNFDSLAKMVKSYSKILKINPDADLSDLFDQMKKLQSIMDGIQNSDNPFDGFVDKGVLTRVAELESGIAAIGAISNEAKAGVSELKTSIATMTNTLKMAGAEKFPGTFKNLFGDSAAEIQKTTKQLEQLQNIQKKLGRTRYDLDDTTGKDLSLNIGVSEDDLNEYDLFVQRFFKLEQKIAQASPDQLQDLAIELQDVATKIVTVFNKMSQSQFDEVPYDDFLNAIDVVINKVQQRRDQLQQELSKLNDMQQQHLSSKLSAKQSSSRSVGVVGTGEIQVTPKTNDAEWVKIINTTIANIEPQLVPVKITPTFAHSSKNIKKEIGADESKITHTVNAKIDIVDNLDDFNERIKYIDKLITNAKKQLEKNTKFNVSFQYEDGGRFKDVVQSVVKDLKNINATVKLTNPKTFKSAINDLKDDAKKQLKDIPATFVIGNQDKILASVDDLRAKIEQKVNNIGVNLNLQNMPEFLAQAAMMRNVVEQVYHDNPVGAISGPVVQDVVANNAVHSVEELSENAQKAKKTLEDCKVALNSLLANKFDAPEFLQFGDIDTHGKKKKDSAKHLESLLKEYKALQAKELNKNRTPEEWSALYPDANGNLEIVRQALKQDLTRLKQLETDLNLYYQKQLAYIQSRQEESEKILETERQIAKTQNKQDGQKEVPSDTSKTTGTNKTTVRSLTGKISYSKKVLDDLNKGWEKSSFFKTLGEWDQDSGKFNKDSKHILELIKKYNQLKDARLAANKETGKNTRAGAEEKKLKQTLDAIHKSQIQHQNEILAKQKQELEQAKKIAVAQKPKETRKKQTGVSKQSVDKLNKAMQQQEELQKKLERTRTIWSDLNKTDFDNNKISSYFTQLGEWDDKTGEFSHNAKSVQDLIEKYQELKRIRAEAGSNEPLKEEIDLRARLDAILEAQKKHVTDYGKTYKAELEKVQKNISAETSTGAVDKQMTNTDSYLKNLTDRLNKAKAAFELLDKKKKNFNNLLKTGIGDSVTHVLGKDSTPEDLQKTVRAYNKLAKEQASLRKSGRTQTTEYKTNAKLLSQLKSQLDAVYTAQLEYSKTRMSQLTAEIAKEEEKKQKLVEQRKLIEQQQKEQIKANNAEKASPKQKDKPTQASGSATVADITSPVVQLDAATLNSLAKDATLRSIDGKIGNIFQSLGKGLKVTGANVSINADNVNVDGNNSSGVKDKKKQADNSKFAHQLAQEMSNGMKDRVERANALSKAGIKVSRGTLLRNGTDAFDEILKGISPRDVVQAVIWPKLVQQLKAKGLTDTDQFNDILAQIATNSPWKSKTSSSWIHFATPGAKFSGNVTKKAYGAFSNVGDITSELINQILNELTAKGFKGQIKIPSDITGFYDTDQIVGHAANDKSFMILVDTLRKFEKQGVLSNIQTGVDSNTKTTLGYKGKQGASFTTMLEEIYKAAPGEAFSVEEIKSIIKTAVASVSGEVDQALFKPIVDNVIKQRGPAVKPVDAPKITSEAEADYTNKRIQKIRDLIAQLNSIDLNRDYRGKFKALLDGPIEASDISGTASLKELISMYDKDVVDFGILKLGDREIPELAQAAHEHITETLKNLLQKQLERLTAELNRLEGTDAVQDVIPPKENQEKIQPTVEQQNMNQQVAASAEKATQEQSELNEELAETQKLAKSVVTENNLTGETSKIVETYRSDDKVNERKEYYGWVPHEDDDPTFEHTATVMTKNMDAYKKLYNDYIKSLAKQMEIQKKIDASDGSTEKLQEELKIQKEITDNLDLQLSKHTELFTTESKQAAINEASKRAQQAFDKASAGQDDSVVNKRIKKLNQMVEDTQNAYNKMRLIQQQFSQGDIGGVEMPLSDSATAQIEKYGQLLDQLQDKQKEISLDPGLLKDDNYLKGINDLIDGLNKAEENFVDLNQEATEFLSRIRSTSDVHILDDAFNPNDIEQMHDAMRNFADGVGVGQAKLLGFNDINRTATFQIKNNAGELQELTVEYNEATNALGRYISKTKESSSGFTKFFDSIKHSFGNVARYLASFGSVYEVFSWIRQGFTYVREIDAALTELKKVTNETESTYDAFLQTMSKTAGVVGSTVADLTTMASEWARLGYSLEEAGILAENTAILLNVSEFDDATEASEALISTMQAFQYTAEDSQHVVDILNEVGKLIAPR